MQRTASRPEPRRLLFRYERLRFMRRIGRELRASYDAVRAAPQPLWLQTISIWKEQNRKNN